MKIVHVITGIAEAAGTSVFACEVASEQYGIIGGIDI